MKYQPSIPAYDSMYGTKTPGDMCRDLGKILFEHTSAIETKVAEMVMQNSQHAEGHSLAHSCYELRSSAWELLLIADELSAHDKTPDLSAESNDILNDVVNSDAGTSA